MSKIYYRVQHLRGTTSEWAGIGKNITPLAGELVIEIDEQHGLHKLKLGDGKRTYENLAYIQTGDEIISQVLSKTLPRKTTISLDVDKWEEHNLKSDDGSIKCLRQLIDLSDITIHSQLDLQPSMLDLNEFNKLGLSFVSENHSGTIYVLSMGNTPTKSYNIQATIIETDLLIDSNTIVGSPITSGGTASVDLSSKPGEKTPEGGEIFNDYKNNQALSDYSTAKGSNTIAGIKGFKITGIDTESSTYKLEGFSNEYIKDDQWCVIADDVISYSEEYKPWGSIEKKRTIESIITDSSDPDNVNVKVNNFVDISGTFNKGKRCYFFVPSKPDVGNVEVGTVCYAEGSDTYAFMSCSHTEGYNNLAMGEFSHAEGEETITANSCAHAEGKRTTASGNSSHSEGHTTTASGNYAHSEGGGGTTASGQSAHAEGQNTQASKLGSHSEGTDTTALGSQAHAEGYRTIASGEHAHSEGQGTKAEGNDSHAEGHATTANGIYSHTEGSGTVTLSKGAHGEGNSSKNFLTVNQTAGINISTLNGTARTEVMNYWLKNGKNFSLAMLDGSHSEGTNTLSLGIGSHSEGQKTIAYSGDSHAEGKETIAKGSAAHAEGVGTTASGEGAHAEGNNTSAMYNYSHAAGIGTETNRTAQTVVGTYNALGNNNDRNKKELRSQSALFVVGNGGYVLTTDITPKTGTTYYTYNKGIYSKFEGTEFISGVEYYTLVKSNAFTVQQDGSALLCEQGTEYNSVVIKETLDGVKSDLSGRIDTLTSGGLYRTIITEDEFNDLIESTESNKSESIIYMVGPKEDSTYDEYMFIKNTEGKLKPELIGSTKVDLSGYATTGDLANKMDKFGEVSDNTTITNASGIKLQSNEAYIHINESNQLELKGDNGVHIKSSLTLENSQLQFNNIILGASTDFNGNSQLTIFEGGPDTITATPLSTNFYDNTFMSKSGIETMGTIELRDILIDETENTSDFPALKFKNLRGNHDGTDTVRVTNLSKPIADVDATNKKYVDEKIIEAKDSISLKDRVTGEIYSIYMNNGELMYEKQEQVV